MSSSERVITPFTADSTAAEVVAGLDLHGRRAVVTGGASGIGIETARALAGAGAEVTLAVRDLDAGHRAAAGITETTGNTAVRVGQLDLADLGSVIAFAAGWDGPLHILVNNAGIMAPPDRQVTKDGVELQFATNHLAHFALALGLHPALAAAGDARVVSLSSVAHRSSPIVFDDLGFERRPYDRWLAYAQSKTATVLFAVEATRRWAGDGITANAVHPGGIRTNLMRHQGDDYYQNLGEYFGGADKVPWKTPEQGAATSVLVATSPLLKGVGGRYFEDCAEAGPYVPPAMSGVAAHALDPEAAARLWDLSVAMTSGSRGERAGSR